MAARIIDRTACTSYGIVNVNPKRYLLRLYATYRQ